MSRSAIIAAKRSAQYAFDHSIDRTSAVRLLTRVGWKVIGRGYFATVVKHSDLPGVVIRIANRKSGRTTRILDGFAEYARWIVKDKVRSTFAPRIYHFLAADDDRYTVTVMEELKKVHSSNKFSQQAWATGRNLSASMFREPNDLKPGPARYFIEQIACFGAVDLHAANVMQRANGSMVFSDPLVITSEGR